MWPSQSMTHRVNTGTCAANMQSAGFETLNWNSDTLTVDRNLKLILLQNCHHLDAVLTSVAVKTSSYNSSLLFLGPCVYQPKRRLRRGVPCSAPVAWYPSTPESHGARSSSHHWLPGVSLWMKFLLAVETKLKLWYREGCVC